MVVVGKRVKASVTGSSILLEWLGEGGVPVSQDQAEERAMVCKHGGEEGKPCPKNWHGDWWSRITKEVALAVMETRRTKFHLDLHISNEDLLGTCRVCLCDLQTKPWVPLKHIINHTSDEVWKELPPHCWIKTEATREHLK